MTYNAKKKNSEIFKVNYKGLTLEFELYTKEYILAELNNLKCNYFESVYEFKVPDDMGVYRFGKYLQEKCKNEECKNYHFFTYIKFFEYEDKEYGVVGGKTNYPLPDISFDDLGENDNRISRTFVHENRNKLKWSTNVIILNHAAHLKYEDDNHQSEFIECFVQRKFNLFDS